MLTSLRAGLPVNQDKFVSPCLSPGGNKQVPRAADLRACAILRLPTTLRPSGTRRNRNYIGLYLEPYGLRELASICWRIFKILSVLRM